ncbi:MAG: hypothetical protein K9N51_10575 [Candidatus Pacebacteria bacterium]|nr:hypothetical protein [Candidatus Paceibacterota bacterium]
MSDVAPHFYTHEIAPVLPPKVLDFHTHTWSADNWKERPWDTGRDGSRNKTPKTLMP